MVCQYSHESPANIIKLSPSDYAYGPLLRSWIGAAQGGTD